MFHAYYRFLKGKNFQLYKSRIFQETGKVGRVHELLINSEKTGTAALFEGNIERFLCLWFQVNSLVHF